MEKQIEEMIELLRQRADVGRMSVQDKQVMLEAADRLEVLTDNNAKLEAIVDLRNRREWYTKFVKEVYQKTPGNELSHPDFDYIYEQYFKLTTRLEVAQDTIRKLESKLCIEKGYCKQSEEGAECPICHGTGRIGTTDWLTKNISKKQLAEEKAKAIAEHEQYFKTEVAEEIFAEIEVFLKRTCEKGYCGSISNLLAELKKKYTEGTK